MTRQELIDDCVGIAASRYFVEPTDVFGRSRTKAVASARQLAMGLIRQIAGWSYPEIGRVFGRDHTTAMHAIKRSAGEVALLAAAPRRCSAERLEQMLEAV